MITQDQLDRIIKAEDILIDVYQELREQRGSSAEAKKLDTILGKIYNLSYSKVTERSKL